MFNSFYFESMSNSQLQWFSLSVGVVGVVKTVQSKSQYYFSMKYWETGDIYVCWAMETFVSGIPCASTVPPPHLCWHPVLVLSQCKITSAYNVRSCWKVDHVHKFGHIHSVMWVFLTSTSKSQVCFKCIIWNYLRLFNVLLHCFSCAIIKYVFVE